MRSPEGLLRGITLRENGHLLGIVASTIPNRAVIVTVRNMHWRFGTIPITFPTT